MPNAVLAYWDIRGLAQPIRLLLEYTGMPWEDKLYACGPAPTFDKTCWFGIKQSLGLDFPNLPYFIDGNVKLTQSTAIIRYIARKHGLMGKTEDEQWRVDLMEGEASDFKGPFTSMCYNPNFTSIKAAYMEGLQAKLKRFSDFLGSRPYFAGDNITYVDFIMYELLDQHKVLEPTCLDGFTNLKEFTNRIEQLDKIKAFMSSPKFIKYPLNNKMASFGG